MAAGLGGAYDSTTVFPVAEQGVLRDVDIAERDLIGPRRLDLTIEYGGRRHSGQVWVDDPSLVPRLREILQRHIDEPLNEIGSLEVDL